MAAGAKLGGALGGVTHDAVNGTLTPISVAGDVMQGVSGFKGLNGAMDNKSILEAFMRDPHQFRVGFANGGLVTGPAMDMASQWAQMDPVQRAMLQAQQAVGPAPVAPVPAQTQQAQHPTLEALSSRGDVQCVLTGEADPFGRRHGVCTYGDEDLNAEMVLRGMALAFSEQSTDYEPQQIEAITAGVGLWQPGAEFMEPWIWRRANTPGGFR